MAFALVFPFLPTFGNHTKKLISLQVSLNDLIVRKRNLTHFQSKDLPSRILEKNTKLF